MQSQLPHCSSLKVKYEYLILVIILFTYSSASAQLWLWGEQGNTGLKSAVYMQNVATNKTGNAYMAGSFETSIIFAPDTLTANFEDIFLVKYGPNGNVLWAKPSKDTTREAPEALSVASDNNDNSYIIELGGSLIKYDPNGNVVWTVLTSGGKSVTTDKFGHEYTIDVGGILSKYDTNGNLIWYKTTTNANNATERGVATDPAGDIFVTGQFTDTLTLGTYKLYSKNQAVFIAKFDGNGNVLWANESTNNSATTAGYSVVTAGTSGAAYLVGVFTDVISFGTHTLTFNSTSNNNFNIAPNYGDLFIVKYNPDGAVAWAREATLADNQSISCLSVSSDDSDFMYVSGISSSSYTFANDTMCKNGPSFLFKFDSLGFVICNSALNTDGYGDQYVPAVASDPSGEYVYMGGIFLGALPVGPDTLLATSAIDPYIARWKPCSACNLVITSPQYPPICDGQNVALTVTGAQNYVWSPATGLNVATGDAVVASPTTNTTYVIASSAKNCTDTGQIVVDVKPLPAFSLSPPTPSICNGQYVVLTANGDSSDISYTWNPATGLSGTMGSSIVAISSVTTTYTVAAMLNGCLDSEQIVVHVGAPIVTILPPNPSVCPGQSILLVASGATTYVWSPTQSLNTAIGDTVVATPSIQTTYTVVGTISGGCSGSDTDVVSIELGLNTPTITQRGDTLFSSATQGNQWVRNDTLIPGATNVFYVITESGWYKVLAINPANGCSTASDSAYFTQTGISQLAINSEQLSVYPNPTGGAVFVNISSSVAEIKDWSLQITDVLGRTVYARQALNYSNAIDISNLSSGVYFITVINKTGRAVVPVVKQ